MSVVRGPLPIYVLASLALTLASCSGQANSVPSNQDVASPAVAAPSNLALAGRVTDAAKILTPAQEAALSGKLERVERTTGHQMVVVTVPTLGGMDVTTFAKNLANSWEIGRKGYNDGVLLLVAPNERKVRIAVGYGLEKTLTHALCKRIIDEQMLPRFREGDLPKGMEAGVDSLIARLS
ncbi:MAG: TPM domain-containing protein [Sphingomicrobium sp.]